MAQWLACAAHNREVGGSKPPSETITLFSHRARAGNTEVEIAISHTSLPTNETRLRVYDVICRPQPACRCATALVSRGGSSASHTDPQRCVGREAAPRRNGSADSCACLPRILGAQIYERCNRKSTETAELFSSPAAALRHCFYFTLLYFYSLAFLCSLLLVDLDDCGTLFR